jgi:hypothetical protein
MNVYTVISSEMDKLSCVAVSELEDKTVELKDEDLFLVSQKNE